MGNVHPIERLAGNFAGRPRREFDSLDCHSRIAILNQAGNRSVAAADVQNGRAGGNFGRKRFREDADTPRKDDASVRLFQNR